VVKAITEQEDVVTQVAKMVVVIMLKMRINCVEIEKDANSPANRALSLCSHCCKHNYDRVIAWGCSDIITELVTIEA
jgi:hypothetical protein